MYETSLIEVINTVVREKAYREYATLAMFIASENEEIMSKESTSEIKDIMGMVDHRSAELKNMVLEDYWDKFIYPGYRLFINENKPKNLRTRGVAEDYLLVEFNVYEDEEYESDIYISISDYETLEEVEEAILNMGNLDDIQDLIVLEKGIVKDFAIEICKCCYLPMVRWFE